MSLEAIILPLAHGKQQILMQCLVPNKRNMNLKNKMQILDEK